MDKRLLIALFALSLLLLACSGGDAQSCKATSDCAPKKCQIATCIEGKCSNSPEQNCCGNGKKDAIEDGKPGNECTCPSDHGDCTGTAKIASGSRTTDAVYVKRNCNSQMRCVMGVDPKELNPITLLDENKLSSFDIEITATLNQPFRVPTDSIQYRITLKDAKDEVVYPIRFTHISLRDGEILFGEKDLSSALGGVGDVATFGVPIAYHLSQPEEKRRITYKIDYEFTINSPVRDGTTTKIVPKTSRESFENRFATQFIFAQDGVE